MISLNVGPKKVKLTEAKSQMVVTRDWVGKNGEMLIKVYPPKNNFHLGRRNVYKI